MHGLSRIRSRELDNDSAIREFWINGTVSAVEALAALAQDNRLRVYRLLVQSGGEGLPATEIAERVGIPPDTLSFHLKTLSHADLVRSRQSGRFIYYSANYEQMNALLGFLTENCCGGRSCVPTAGAALATVVGVLVEVPVMLSVVRIVNATRDWYESGRRVARVPPPSVPIRAHE